MFKYKVLQADTLINEQQLNKLASEGWRLVTIVSEGGQFYFYFETVNTAEIKAIK